MTATSTGSPGWIDTHAHLADERLALQLSEALRRAGIAGLSQILAVGTTADDSTWVAQLARSQSGIRAAVGIHPNYAAQAADVDWPRIVSLANDPRVAAIGETGLDRHWDFTPFHLQQEFFERHIELAIARDLPLVIHCRDCEDDIIRQLEPHAGHLRGVLHSFTGTHDHATAFLALGLDLSFAGMLTYKGRRSDPLRAVAATVPADRILVETDSPYLTPHPHRGRTNEPAMVVHTGAIVADLRGIPVEDLAAQTSANARRLFRLDPADRLPTA